MNKYLILTNDTEALPNRARDNHVRRLMWGEHENGVAGVKEMTSVVKEFNGKITYFVDICGALDRKSEVLDVARWLNDNGQDVELHLHPEYLPDSFWDNTGYRLNPKLMNLYEEIDRDKLRFLFKTFAGELESVIGRKINAYRAGSFRWNAMTIELLKELDIPLSFNNTQASMALGQCPYASSMQRPFRWSNGIIEVPVTEKNFFPNLNDNWWVRYQYPLCSLVRYRTGLGSIIPYSVSAKDDFLVCLMHSWSFLYRDDDGFEYYRDDKRKEDFRKMLRKMSRDFDIIDSRDLKDLIDSGKIVVDHTEDIKKAVYIPDSLKRERMSREQIKNKNYAFLSNEIDHNSNYCNDFFSDKRFYYGLSCCLSPSMIHKYLSTKDNLNHFKIAYTGNDADGFGGKVVVSSRMMNKVESACYLPLDVNFEIKDFLFNGKLPLYIAADSEQNITFGLYLFDETGKKVDSKTYNCNCNNFISIPDNVVTFSLALRVPEGFKSAEVKYIAMTFVDNISTHIIPIEGDDSQKCTDIGDIKNADDSLAGIVIEADSNNRIVGDSESTGNSNSSDKSGIMDNVNLSDSDGKFDNYFRLSVHNLENKKNGVVIVFPHNVIDMAKQSVVNYPNFSTYISQNLEQKLEKYTVIYVAEPFLSKQFKYSGSWFFNEEGRSLIPLLAKEIKKLIGDDSGKVICTGYAMGADLALQYSLTIGADYCICDNINPCLLTNPYFRNMSLSVAKKHNAIHVDEGITDKRLIIEQENSCISKYYDIYLLYLRYELKKYSNFFHGKTYFYYHLLNPKNVSLIKDLTIVKKKYRKKFESKIIMNSIENCLWYGRMSQDDMAKLICDLFG